MNEIWLYDKFKTADRNGDGQLSLNEALYFSFDNGFKGCALQSLPEFLTKNIMQTFITVAAWSGA